MKMGDKIRYYRKTLNLSQPDLAEGICSVSYLSKIENNQTIASKEILYLLFNKLERDFSIFDDNHLYPEKLNQWYFSIFCGDNDKAEKLGEELQSENVYDIEYQIKYKILHSMYYLLITDKRDTADNNIKELSSIKEVMSAQNVFLFYLLKGIQLYFKKDFSEGYSYLKNCEGMLHKTPVKITRWEEGYLYYLLALYSSSLWKNMNGLDYTKTALNIFEEMYLFKRCADCRILMGIIYQRIENYAQASKHLYLAETIANTFNDNQLRGMVFQNLGYIESKKGNSEEAIRLYKLSLKYKQKDNCIKQVSTIFTLIEEYYKNGDFEKGVEMVKNGLELVRQDASFKDYELHYYFYYLVFKKGKYNDETITFLADELIPFFQKNNKQLHLPELYKIVAEYFEMKAKYKSANRYYKMSINTLRKFTQTEGL